MIVWAVKNPRERIMNLSNLRIHQRRTIMWTKPEVTEMRFGFEVTMYVCNR